MTQRALDFIPIPERSRKPRTRGLTLARDYGIGFRQAQDWMESVGEFIDYIKMRHLFTLLAPLDAEHLMMRKIRLYREHQVEVNPGGTVFELAWLNKQVERCFATLAQLGFTAVECSENMIPLSPAEKVASVKAAKAEGLKVMFEVGEKYPTGALDVDMVVRDMDALKEAGCDLGVLEKSLMEQCLGPQADRPEAEKLVQIAERVGLDFVVFEAESVIHHGWLFRTFGPDASLGPNLEPEYIAKLEATRRTLSREGGYTFLSDQVQAMAIKH